jgi:pimeloyl-[acyl-carrier protein] methyl ester esterase
MSQLYYRSFGQGKPIVLVHGWAMHSGVWDEFAEQLAQHYRVTCIDLPGHGRSGMCDEFTLANISSALVNAVDDEKACWLGWSLGATVVLDVAARFPERVSSLILLAGNPRFVQEDETWPGMPIDVFDAFSRNLQQDSAATLAQFVALQFLGMPGGKSQLHQLRARLNECVNPCQKVLQSGLGLLRHSDLRAVLSKLAVPMSVILGGKDVLVPAAVGQYFIECSSKTQVQCIENAGHALFQSHPEQVLAGIAKVMAVL